jgi:hypothetical protein
MLTAGWDILNLPASSLVFIRNYIFLNVPPFYETAILPLTLTISPESLWYKAANIFCSNSSGTSNEIEWWVQLISKSLPE